MNIQYLATFINNRPFRYLSVIAVRICIFLVWPDTGYQAKYNIWQDIYDSLGRLVSLGNSRSVIEHFIQWLNEVIWIWISLKSYHWSSKITMIFWLIKQKCVLFKTALHRITLMRADRLPRWLVEAICSKHPLSTTRQYMMIIV